MLARFHTINLKQKLTLGFCLTIGIIFLSIMQDLAHSQIRNYHFYISESLLYSSFWAMFFPLVLVQLSALEWISGITKHARIVWLVAIAGLIIVLHLLLFPLMVIGFSEVFFEHTYNYRTALQYELSEYLYLCLGVYGGIGAFIHFKTKTKPIIIEENTTILETLIIQKGTERLLLSVDSIFCMTAESPYVALHTETKKYLYSDSLTSLMGQLDSVMFVRIHKSTIIHIGKVTSYTSRKNGDYDVLLHNGLKVRMSRTYTADFKALIT